MKEGRGNSGRGQRRQRSGMCWIAAVYVLLLVLDTMCLQQVAALSACHDPPQVIRISRGQKITVEYWVGQNAVDGQQPLWPQSETDGVSTTDTPQELTTVAPPAELLPSTTEKTPSSSTTSPPTVSTVSVVKVNETEPDITEKIILATAHQQEAAKTERVTSPPEVVDRKDSQEGGPTQATELQERGFDSTTDFYRNDMAEVTTSSGKSEVTSSGGPEVTVPIEEVEAASSSTSDVTVDARRHEARELSTEHSSDDHQGASSSSSSFDDGLTEIAYWATSPPPSSGDDNQVNSRKADGSDVTSTSDEPSVTDSFINLTSRSNNVTDDVTEGSGRNEKSAEESTSTAASLAEATGRSSFDDQSRNETEIDGRIAESNETSTPSEEESTTILSSTEEPEVKGKSVLDTISTTIRSILSTLAPAQEEVTSSDVTSLSPIDARSATGGSTSADVTELPEQNSTEAAKKTRGDTILENDLNNATGVDNQDASESSSIASEESTAGDQSVTISGRAATEDAETTSGNDDNIANSTATISGRAATTSEPENSTGSGGDSTETGDGATSTDAVILLDVGDDVLTEKSAPAPTTEPKQEAATTAPPTARTIDNVQAQQEIDLTAVAQSPETSGRPAEGARKFENPDVNINGEVKPGLARPQATGEESGFRSVVLVRNRKRKPFGSRRNRKPNFVRHRPPYVTLESEDRPTSFLSQSPSGDRMSYVTEDVAQDRSDPMSQVVLMDAGDQLDSMLEDASSAGATYYAAPGNTYDDNGQFQQRSDLFPPQQSPVHYVSVVRPPDGGLPVRDLRMTGSGDRRRRVLLNRNTRSVDNATTNCQWVFRSDPGVPLLLTFKSFSTPQTPDCRDHHISVERESNGFQSRWCGASGDRPGHAAFARSEINLQLFSVGDGSFPTGFSVEVQALDLKLLRKYAEVRRIIKG